MENSCFYQNQVFRQCRGLEISYLDGKQPFISKSGVQEVQRLQNQLFRWKTAVYIKIRCLVSAEGSKSAISDGKQLFISKSGVQEVQTARNQLLILEGNQLFLSKSGFSKCKGLKISYFGWKTVVYIKIRCLGSAEDWKSAIQMENSHLYHLLHVNYSH